MHLEVALAVSGGHGGACVEEACVVEDNDVPRLELHLELHAERLVVGHARERPPRLVERRQPRRAQV